MKTFVFLLIFLVGNAHACGVLPENEQRERDREELQLQLQLTAEFSEKATLIFIGKARIADADAGQGEVHFTVSRILKGKAERDVTLRADRTKGIVISCWESDMFGSVFIRAGAEYIVYFNGSVVTRAAPTLRGPGQLPVEREEQIIRSRVAT